MWCLYFRGETPVNVKKVTRGPDSCCSVIHSKTKAWLLLLGLRLKNTMLRNELPEHVSQASFKNFFDTNKNNLVPLLNPKKTKKIFRVTFGLSMAFHSVICGAEHVTLVTDGASVHLHKRSLLNRFSRITYNILRLSLSDYFRVIT